MNLESIVGALADHQPEALAALRVKHPAYAEYLVQGHEMGPDANGETPSTDELMVRVDVCTAGLAALATPVTAEIARLRKRVRAAWILQSVAEFLAVVGASSVLVVLSEQSDSSASFVGWLAAGLATVGSFFAFFAGLFQHTPLGGKTTERYRSLIETWELAIGIQQELHIWRITRADSIDALDGVKTGNTLAETLRKLLRGA